MKILKLSSETPRDLSSLGDTSWMTKGLKLYFVFGYLFVGFLAFLLVFVVFFSPHTSNSLKVFQIIGGLVLFGGLGALSLRHAFHVQGERGKALLFGQPVKARVIRQGKQFNPFKSGRDHNVTVRFSVEGQTQEKKYALYVDPPQTYSVGKELEGLYDQASGSAFFPELLGLQIEW